MNCKQGELAFIVRASDKRNIGKVVKVLRPYTLRAEPSWWIVSSSELHNSYGFWPAGAEVATYDAYLRPIRDPGEDAVDEVVQRLGKPITQPEEVPA